MSFPSFVYKRSPHPRPALRHPLGPRPRIVGVPIAAHTKRKPCPRARTSSNAALISYARLLPLAGQQQYMKHRQRKHEWHEKRRSPKEMKTTSTSTHHRLPWRKRIADGRASCARARQPPAGPTSVVAVAPPHCRALHYPTPTSQHTRIWRRRMCIIMRMLLRRRPT